MNKKEKLAAIAVLKEKLDSSEFFYITDSSGLSVEEVNNLRRSCFEKGVELRVVKNTLTRKAMDQFPEEKGFQQLYDSLNGPSAIMFAESANVPAQIIREFRKDHKKPILKAAYIEASIYIGDDEVTTLANLKSKQELIAEIILMLESSVAEVISGLDAGAMISGLLTALERRES